MEDRSSLMTIVKHDQIKEKKEEKESSGRCDKREGFLVISQMSQWWFSSLLGEENGRQEQQSHDNCQK